MQTMHSIRVMPGIGRIFPIVGKAKTTLIGQFSSGRHRALFGSIKWELTHWSDIDLVQFEMIQLATGNYGQLATLQAREIVAPRPESEYRH